MFISCGKLQRCHANWDGEGTVEHFPGEAQVGHWSEGRPEGPRVVSVYDATGDRDDARARHDAAAVGVAPDDPETAVLENRDHGIEVFPPKFGHFRLFD